MKIVVLIDSYKGSLSSLDAGNIVRDAILADNPDYNVIVKAIADGGEGTIEALESSYQFEVCKLNNLYNPLMEKISGKYLYSLDNNLALMEMSQTGGHSLISDRLDPLNATTYGLGQMIENALNKGIKEFVIGIGGSSTSDGGIGMLQSLGAKFLDSNNNEISKGAVGIEGLEKIDLSNFDKRIYDSVFKIACDVDNPLFGKNGAAYVFSPQKGANPDQVKFIDTMLRKYHDKTLEVFNNSDADFPGAGAAGGLGYAFKNYMNAKLEVGIDLILEMIDVEKDIKDCDLVITGEGKMDFQTAMGKASVGVAKLAKKYNKKVIAISGSVENNAVNVHEKGIDAFFTIIDKVRTLDEAMNYEVARENLTRTTKEIFNVINLWK